MATNGDAHQTAIFGNKKDFWLYDSNTGFDLTHPTTPTSSRVKNAVTFATETTPITIDPAKSALIIIDMQNFFLSPALGKERGPGHEALDQLVQNAVPAARKAGVRVIWVNWGLTKQEIEDMPPSILKAFGFREGKKTTGLGNDMGTVSDPDSGKKIDVGNMLMRDQWNSALCPPLDKMFEEGKKLETRPDVWIHKNRMSGMWGPNTELQAYLEEQGIKTLLFTGVNTDQCVGGTYQDSFSKGYDCILLSDGCGTTSPNYSQQCIEFNAGNVWGFAATCKAFADGVDKLAM